MSRRQEKVASVLRSELSQLFLFEVSDPVLQGLVIQEVQTTPDLKIARVYYSSSKPTGEKERALAFSRVERFLRSELGKRLNLRYIPKFDFILDEHQESLTRIYKLFDDIHTSPQ